MKNEKSSSVVPNVYVWLFDYNETYLLHFCSTGRETSTRFLSLWFVQQQPRGTPFCLTTLLWPGCWVQDGLCPYPAWTWPLDHKACPSHCNERRVDTMCLDKRSIGFLIRADSLRGPVCPKIKEISEVYSDKITMFTTWLHITFFKTMPTWPVMRANQHLSA